VVERRLKDAGQPPQRQANRILGHGTWENDRPPTCSVVGRGKFPDDRHRAVRRRGVGYGLAARVGPWRTSTPMSDADTTGCPRWAGPSRRSASTRWRVVNGLAEPSCDRSVRAKLQRREGDFCIRVGAAESAVCHHLPMRLQLLPVPWLAVLGCRQPNSIRGKEIDPCATND
jgi:hypothetical protein